MMEGFCSIFMTVNPFPNRETKLGWPHENDLFSYLIKFWKHCTFLMIWNFAKKHYLVIGERKVNMLKNLHFEVHTRHKTKAYGLTIKDHKGRRREGLGSFGTKTSWKVWKTLTSSWKFDHVSISCYALLPL